MDGAAASGSRAGGAHKVGPLAESKQVVAIGVNATDDLGDLTFEGVGSLAIQEAPKV